MPRPPPPHPAQAALGEGCRRLGDEHGLDGEAVMQAQQHLRCACRLLRRAGEDGRTIALFRGLSRTIKGHHFEEEMTP